MKHVFISYRRIDSQDAVALLCERLLRLLPADALFRDCDNLLPGDLLTDGILSALKSSIVVIAVIGPDWAEGSLGIHNTSDWVRQELDAAISIGIPVIPVLVRGANRPTVSTLPAELKRVADLLFLELRTDHNLNADFERLMTTLLKHGVDPEKYRPTKVNLELFVEACHAIPRFFNEPQLQGCTYDYVQNLSFDEAHAKRALPCIEVTMQNRGIEVLLTEALINLGNGSYLNKNYLPTIPFTFSSSPEFRYAQGRGVTLFERDYSPVFRFAPDIRHARQGLMAVCPMDAILEFGITAIKAVDSHGREYFAHAHDVSRTNKYLHHHFHGVDLRRRLELIAQENHDVLAAMNGCDCPRCAEPNDNCERLSRIVLIPKLIRQLLRWK